MADTTSNGNTDAGRASKSKSGPITPKNSPHHPAKSAERKAADAAMGVKNPDAFQDSLLGFWEWVEKNGVAVMAVLVLLVVGVAVNAALSWWSRHQEHNAQEAYFGAEVKYTKTKEGFERAKMKALMPAMANKDDKTVDVPATGDLNKDYGTAIGDLEKVARDYKGTTAGAQAAILAADAYLDYKQADKAIELAQIPVKELGQKSLLGSLARMLWGTALADKGDCKEAVTVWKPVIDNASVSFLHADASLRSGLCFETMGDSKQAIEMYQKAAGQGETSESATAKGLLRALELKAKPATPPTKAS